MDQGTHTEGAQVTLGIQTPEEEVYEDPEGLSRGLLGKLVVPGWVTVGLQTLDM